MGNGMDRVDNDDGGDDDDDRGGSKRRVATADAPAACGQVRKAAEESRETGERSRMRASTLRGGPPCPRPTRCLGARSGG